MIGGWGGGVGTFKEKTCQTLCFTLFSLQFVDKPLVFILFSLNNYDFVYEFYCVFDKKTLITCG